MRMDEIEDGKRTYRMGQCDVFALALHKLTGLPLGVWRGYYPDPDGDGEAYEDCHAAVVVRFGPDPIWADVDGPHRGRANCYFVNKIDRVELVEVNSIEMAEAFTSEKIDPQAVKDAIKFAQTDPICAAWLKSL